MSRHAPSFQFSSPPWLRSRNLAAPRRFAVRRRSSLAISKGENRFGGLIGWLRPSPLVYPVHKTPVKQKIDLRPRKKPRNDPSQSTSRHCVLPLPFYRAVSSFPPIIPDVCGTISFARRELFPMLRVAVAQSVPCFCRWRHKSLCEVLLLGRRPSPPGPRSIWE